MVLQWDLRAGRGRSPRPLASPRTRSFAPPPGQRLPRRDARRPRRSGLPVPGRRPGDHLLQRRLGPLHGEHPVRRHRPPARGLRAHRGRRRGLGPLLDQRGADDAEAVARPSSATSTAGSSTSSGGTGSSWVPTAIASCSASGATSPSGHSSRTASPTASASIGSHRAPSPRGLRAPRPLPRLRQPGRRRPRRPRRAGRAARHDPRLALHARRPRRARYRIARGSRSQPVEPIVRARGRTIAGDIRTVDIYTGIDPQSTVRSARWRWSTTSPTWSTPPRR